MATIIIPAVTFGDIYIIYAKRILALDMKLFLLTIRNKFLRRIRDRIFEKIFYKNVKS